LICAKPRFIAPTTTCTPPTPTTGAFSLQDINSWVAAALPDLPPHAPTTDGGKGGGGGGAGGDVRYSFRSCQAGSLLGCSIAAGTARFVR
jgi:hypothetical protein